MNVKEFIDKYPASNFLRYSFNDEIDVNRKRFLFEMSFAHDNNIVYNVTRTDSSDGVCHLHLQVEKPKFHKDKDGHKMKFSSIKALDKDGKVIAVAPTADIAVKQAVLNYRVSRETEFKEWKKELIEIGLSCTTKIETYEEIKRNNVGKPAWFIYNKMQEMHIKLRDYLREVYRTASVENYRKYDIFAPLPNNFISL